MNASFLLLLLAAGILRFLAEDAKNCFTRRLTGLLPRKIMERHLQILFRDYPEHFAEFRRRVLPFSALHIAFNAAACGSFIFALWYTPPAALSPLALLCIRCGSMIVVPLAFVLDVILFSKLLASTRSLPLEEPES